jgi:hypothetical protein
MMGDRLSKREDRAIHRALASIVLTQYPNPDRKDCPGTSVLRDIATKSIPMRHPAHEHVGSCSPCFSELTQIRRALHRRNLVWAMGTAGAAVLVLAVVAYFAFLPVKNPVTQEAVKPGGTAGNGQAAGSTPSVPPSQAEFVSALLDLRSASATRTASGSNAIVQPIEIPRGRLTLTVQLPIGSEARSYEVGIRKSPQLTLVISMGRAQIENGITRLVVNMDTSSIPSGQYEFGWRPVEFDWRYHPIVIR